LPGLRSRGSHRASPAGQARFAAGAPAAACTGSGAHRPAPTAAEVQSLLAPP